MFGRPEVSVGPVLSAIPIQDDKKLYALTSRMKKLATDIKEQSNNGDATEELATTVLHFLKVAGWMR